MLPIYNSSSILPLSVRYLPNFLAFLEVHHNQLIFRRSIELYFGQKNKTQLILLCICIALLIRASKWVDMQMENLSDREIEHQRMIMQ